MAWLAVCGPASSELLIVAVLHSPLAASVAYLHDPRLSRALVPCVDVRRRAIGGEHVLLSPGSLFEASRLFSLVGVPSVGSFPRMIVVCVSKPTA